MNLKQMLEASCIRHGVESDEDWREGFNLRWARHILATYDRDLAKKPDKAEVLKARRDRAQAMLVADTLKK